MSNGWKKRMAEMGIKPDYDKAAKRMHGFDEKYQYTPWDELPASAQITFERMSRRIVDIALIEGVEASNG